MPDMAILAFDLGGTDLKVARIAGDGGVHGFTKLPSNASQGEAALLEAITRAARSVGRESSPEIAGFGPAGGCGVEGCAEPVASGAGLVARAREVGLAVTSAREVFESSDPRAAAVLERMVDHLARMLGAAAALLNPDVIVVGGGVAMAGEALLGPLRERFAEQRDRRGAHDLHPAERPRRRAIVGPDDRLELAALAVELRRVRAPAAERRAVDQDLDVAPEVAVVDLARDLMLLVEERRE